MASCQGLDSKQISSGPEEQEGSFRNSGGRTVQELTGIASLTLCCSSSVELCSPLQLQTSTQEPESVTPGGWQTLETLSSVSFMVQVRDLRHRGMKRFAQSHTVDNCEQNPDLLSPGSNISSAVAGQKVCNRMDSSLSC